MSENKTPFAPFIPFLILISFVSFLNILARVIFAPLTPYICEEMHLCHADTGNLFFTLSVGFAITLFASQFISSKISHKKTILLSILMTGVALILTSYAETFKVFRLSLFLVGLCSGLFIPSAVSMIREEVSDGHLGKAFGIFATAQSVAFILGPIIVQSTIQHFTWQEILKGFGLFSSLLTLLLYSLFKKGEVKGEPITVPFVKEMSTWPAFWILMILLCFANGLTIGIYNMAPDYFQRHNLLEPGMVYKLIIIGRALSVVTAVAAGVFADRFGLKRSLVLAFVACGALTALMGSAPPSASLALFCLQSPVGACLMPLIHFAVATIVPAEKNAAIVSITAPFGFFMGAGAVPQILGFLGDFNLYAEGFVLFGMTAIVAGVIFNVNAVYRHVEMGQMKSVELK